MLSCGKKTGSSVFRTLVQIRTFMCVHFPHRRAQDASVILLTVDIKDLIFIFEHRNLRNQIIPRHVANVIVIQGIKKVLFTTTRIWRKKIVLYPPITLEGKFGVGLWSPNGDTIMDSK